MSNTVVQEYRDEEGRLHREDGPSYIGSLGSQAYHIHGKLHREDGPAHIWYDGTEEYYIHGERHREDGPAWCNDPDGTKEYWIHGTQVPPFHSKEEYNLRLLGLIAL